MGLLVDLTNTTRFYDRNDIEKEGIKYVKLQCKGYACICCLELNFASRGSFSHGIKPLSFFLFQPWGMPF